MARGVRTGRLPAEPEVRALALVNGLRQRDHRFAVCSAFENPLVTANRAGFRVQFGERDGIGKQGAAFCAGALLARQPRSSALRSGSGGRLCRRRRKHWRTIRQFPRRFEFCCSGLSTLTPRVALHPAHGPAGQSNNTGKPPQGGRINNQSHYILREPNHPTASRSRHAASRIAAPDSPFGATLDIMPQPPPWGNAGGYLAGRRGDIRPGPSPACGR